MTSYIRSEDCMILKVTLLIIGWLAIISKAKEQLRDRLKFFFYYYETTLISVFIGPLDNSALKIWNTQRQVDLKSEACLWLSWCPLCQRAPVKQWFFEHKSAQMMTLTLPWGKVNCVVVNVKIPWVLCHLNGAACPLTFSMTDERKYRARVT